MKPKLVSISVTEFALPAPRRGSIDVFSGLGRAQTLGMEVHERIQAERAKSYKEYRAEEMIQGEFKQDAYLIKVSGKMDGFFDRPVPRIEEIKSSFNIKELHRRIREDFSGHPYALQLRMYGYLHWLKTNKIPDLSLLLVSTRNGETIELPIPLDLPELEKWLALRLEEISIEAKAAEQRARRRKRAAEACAFPFDKPRTGQRELIASIEEGMAAQQPMLIQAPTGLGKTVGVMYPTLREALGRGQRLIYVTPKNSQHSVAEHALKLLRDARHAGAEPASAKTTIKSMTLTAKSRLCFKNEPLCNPDYCEFAKDHYTKVREKGLIAELAKKRSLTAKTFRKVAEKAEVCPFELQLEASQLADVVVCDYNYVFAPRSRVANLTGPALGQSGKPNLVIDEAHNLPSRAMDYFSPELSVDTLSRMRDEAARLPKRFRADVLALIESSIEVVRACGPLDQKGSAVIQPPIEAFMAQEADLRAFLSTYLNSDVVIEPKDIVLRLSFYWTEFTQALEFVCTGREEFFTTFQAQPARIRITCCDASEMLKSSYEDYQQVVAFSATLKPFAFYSRLGGFAEDKLKLAEFQSPFPPSRRKLLIIPQISSKYSQRDRNAPRIAEAIARIAALREGNYFAFFPSFDFMMKVLAVFKAPPGFDVLRQERAMSREKVDGVLKSLAWPGSAQILFAVQGGVFSEGIDYPGDMAIGAFIVGPPLPTFDLEREKMRDYYQKHHSSGYDYAYVYPAMAKAVQAAGRVIRSETDRGIIVLMDDRFTHNSYAKAMPSDWFVDRPHELVSKAILREVSDFWAGS